MVSGIRHKTFRSFDGTEIAYQIRGQGPCVIFSNDLAATHEVYRHLHSLVGEGYEVLSWDYRGTNRSARPRDLRTLAVPYHCHDLALLLDGEGVEQAVFIGWSMGVQVNFEFFSEHQRRVAGMVLVSGTYGLPWRTAMAALLVRAVIPSVRSMLKARSPVLRWLMRRAWGQDGVVPLLKRLRLVSDTSDDKALGDLEEGFKNVDWEVFSETLRLLAEHDAQDLLSSVDVPSLILAGTRDPLAPQSVVRRMNRQIAGSRLVMVEGGTHFTPIEHAAIVRDETARFLAGIPGWAPPGDSERAA